MTPTLLEDLDLFAELLDLAPKVRARVRGHAQRIRELATEGNDGDYGEGVLDAIERINNGPVTR